MGRGATVEALVDAAEALFAHQGFEQASLRAVMRNAGSDPGAIHYHFGGREALAAAVLDRVLRPLNQRRLDLLAEAVAAAGDDPVSLHALVDAIVRPDLEAATELQNRGQGRARLIGEIYIDPAAFVTSEVERHFVPVAQRFMPHLLTAVPDVPGEILAWRVRWCLFAVVGAVLSDPQEPRDVELEELVTRIVTTGAAALAAPTTVPTALSSR